MPFLTVVQELIGHTLLDSLDDEQVHVAVAEAAIDESSAAAGKEEEN